MSKENVMEILDKLEFFGGQRAGRELWADKPKEIQDKDIEDFCRDLQIVRSAIKDAEPVRHGRWKFGKQHEDFVQVECSACGGWLLVKWHDDIDRYRHCPNCGAKMDEGVQ